MISRWQSIAAENAELLKKVAELEARVKELEPVVVEEVQEEAEAA